MAHKKIYLDKSVISRDPSLDFSDDGTRFVGYKYKGKLPITRASGTEDLYLCIRLDYLSFSYNEYKDDYDILDYYNGVDREEFSAPFFNELCEYIYQKYLENNEIERPI